MRGLQNRYQWAAAAVVVALVASAVVGWWWHSTNDERALRDVVERQYARCLAQAAIDPESYPGESNLWAERCDLQRDATLERLGL